MILGDEKQLARSKFIPTNYLPIKLLYLSQSFRLDPFLNDVTLPIFFFFNKGPQICYKALNFLGALQICNLSFTLKWIFICIYLICHISYKRVIFLKIDQLSQRLTVHSCTCT